MPTAKQGEARIEIAAAPAQVYDVVSNITQMGQWSPECYRCEWLDGADGPAVGARFRGYNRAGLIRWARSAEITQADPGREFSFKTIDDNAGREQTHWHYRMQPAPGGTLLTESFEFVWCPLHERFVELFLPRNRQMRRGLEQTLQRIKHAVESRTTTGPEN